jgi:DNA-binding transcriptional LysR family regulator
MELRHLESFLAIADELHFGRAAARLHITQPSLSQHLRRLERSLGVQLVQRSSHEVRLTPAGRAFRAEATVIMAQLRRAATAAREAASGSAGTLKVGYNFPAAQHVLPGALARMAADCPAVTVALSERRSGPQLSALSEHELDLALVYGRPAGSRFQGRKLGEVPMVAVVGGTHPWATRPGVPFAELAAESCVLFDRAQCPAMHDAILAAAESAGIVLDVTHIVDDPGATALRVSMSPVVGFASAARGLSVGALPGDTRPVGVRLYDPVPIVDLYAVWLADDDNPVRENFVDRIHEMALSG